jgi:hypothetical protein
VSFSIGQKIKDILIRVSDSSAPLGGELAKTGGAVVEQHEITGLSARLQELIDLLMSNKNWAEVYSNKTHKSVLEFCDIALFVPELTKLLLSKKIVSMVNNYLGPHIWLDYMRLVIVKVDNLSLTENSNKSDLVHHDSVGHRLKLFIPVGDALQVNPTRYYLGSNLSRWKTYANSVRESQEIDALEKGSRGKRWEILSPSKEDFLIFDTNGLHAGDYRPTGNLRASLQFEFSSGGKRKLIRGQVGQAKTVLSASTLKELSAIYKMNHPDVSSKSEFEVEIPSCRSRISNDLYLRDFLH